MSSNATPQTFFMTGCGSGIGQYVADLLVDRGDRVYATDVNLAALEEHAKTTGWPEERVRLDVFDVRFADAWEEVFARAVEAFGRIDVCMNIAGVMFSGWAHEQPVNEVDLQIDVNTKGVIWGTQVAARHMKEMGGGHIVNISSLAGISSIPGISVYSASKFAVRGFSLAAGFELKRHGVYVTTFCPNAIRTPLLKQASEHDAGAMVFSSGRLLTLEEIGEVMLNRVLTKKQPEVSVPLRWAVTARIANLLPNFGAALLPSLFKKGRRFQSELANSAKDDTVDTH
jgi:3-oxoacyl-[acyl-carrier protein] reductase